MKYLLVLPLLAPLALAAAPIGPTNDGTPRFPGRSDVTTGGALTLPEQTLSADKPWYNEIEFGYLMTAGNSETESLNAKTKSQYESGDWRSRLELTALNSSAEDSRTGERYNALGKSDYKFTDKDYSFLRLEYDRDRFSGFDYQGNGAFGLGRRFVDEPNMLFEMEAGPGYREAREELSQEKHSDTIFYAGQRFSWQFSENAQLIQQLSFESGNENQISEAALAMKVGFTKNFALKLSVRGEYTDQVPEGVEKMDTETGVNLVYGF